LIIVLRDQKQYLLAAHSSLFETIESVETKALVELKKAQDRVAVELKKGVHDSKDGTETK
jgi:hypothetical protein